MSLNEGQILSLQFSIIVPPIMFNVATTNIENTTYKYLVKHRVITDNAHNYQI